MAARLTYHHGAMNAGKSVHLLTTRYAHVDSGRNALVLTSSIDNRSGLGVVKSRVGISADAIIVSERTDVFALIEARHKDCPVDLIFVDEVQFFQPEHIRQLARVVDVLGIEIHTYGLKVNSKGELFGPGIHTLLALADEIIDIPSACHCGCKATMILRYDMNGRPDLGGPVVEVGGESRYVSVCRRHWMEGDIGHIAKERLPQPAGVAA